MTLLSRQAASKNALLRGEADNMPKDGAQLKLMLDNLNQQETAMT